MIDFQRQRFILNLIFVLRLVVEEEKIQKFKNFKNLSVPKFCQSFKNSENLLFHVPYYSRF